MDHMAHMADQLTAGTLTPSGYAPAQGCQFMTYGWVSGLCTEGLLSNSVITGYSSGPVQKTFRLGHDTEGLPSS